ncbi:hypothetical protein G7Z17_g6057 [Cylindrodendrum hubeiense]|uniref:asparaginase n=1 Tax=Cylindrodendrum hubeiense TaxID=595255 RepID=A0A9P5HAX3_9HYPO|nr:hypothetical protein G7Z17_g6057 [Cylindrodendrum hubeiense]
MLPKFLTIAARAMALGALVLPMAQAGFDSDLDWISTNSSLPKVVAKGTILSASNYSRLDNVNYGAGVGTTPQELIGNVSEVLDVAQIAVIDFDVTGGSSGLNSSLYLNISQHANRQLCSKDSDIVGAIMFHGTNTLEETAFGVDLTFNCSKPFIATGAMRPNSYISPDGRITSIFYSTKVNANTPDTFKALEQGNLGVFLGGQPFYYFDAGYPTGRPHFDITNTTGLSSVIILYGHQGFDASLMYAAVANGAKGLVILGPGAAQLSPSAQVAAADLFEQGIPTVAVARPVTGTGVPGRFPGPIFYSSYVGAEQARIMLQLAINAGFTLDEIRDVFETPLRKAVYGSWASQKAYYL